MYYNKTVYNGHTKTRVNSIITGRRHINADKKYCSKLSAVMSHLFMRMLCHTKVMLCKTCTYNAIQRHILFKILLPVHRKLRFRRTVDQFGWHFKYQLSSSLKRRVILPFPIDCSSNHSTVFNYEYNCLRPQNMTFT